MTLIEALVTLLTKTKSHDPPNKVYKFGSLFMAACAILVPLLEALSSSAQSFAAFDSEFAARLQGNKKPPRETVDLCCDSLLMLENPHAPNRRRLARKLVAPAHLFVRRAASDSIKVHVLMSRGLEVIAHGASGQCSERSLCS